jgi:hypothetical protein
MSAQGLEDRRPAKADAVFVLKAFEASKILWRSIPKVSVEDPQRLQF